MRIEHFVIQNFRKLKCCRIELGEKETLFVGANNSGKTSAMDALMLFLKQTSRKKIATTDFTLSNWAAINQIGNDWIKNSTSETTIADLSREHWEPYMPELDIWITVEEEQIHYVSHILPTLDWEGGLLGVRIVFEPQGIESLYQRFMAAYSAAKKTMEAKKAESGTPSSLSLWPKNMQEFLEKELHLNFKMQAYILDPAKTSQDSPQELPQGSLPLEGDPFAGLFKIDIINAQRGFSDPGSEESESINDRRLSAQLRKYFDKHLDPTDMPDENDIEALEAIETARTAFDEKLKMSFQPALSELEGLNYPGFTNPSIELSSRVKPLDGLNHDSAVRFSVNRPEPGSTPLTLPEKYNGLGYQNLISMVFKLIRFRDEWMRVKKSGKRESDGDRIIEPLHLVLIEEPEAHLHAQVQQVFIKKAYNVLRNHSDLGTSSSFSTQLVLSTHSSHIAHEIDFASLRYFRRKPAESIHDVPCATVANLSNVFGGDDETSKFAIRYLKTTHCDLFFADAAILVEGPAERMLVPHFIRSKFQQLDSSYLTILEIGGSHAHRLRPLVEAMELLTLVVTDLDSIEETSLSKVLPEKNKNYRTRNSTIKEWVPGKTDLDKVLSTTNEEKIAPNGNVRVAYQCPITLKLDSQKDVEAIPYTFEDALVLENLEFFKNRSDDNGLMKKMCEAAKRSTISETCKDMYEALKSGDKAEMALDLLYIKDPEMINPPQYIREGLEWLQGKLQNKAQEFPETVTPSGNQP